VASPGAAAPGDATLQIRGLRKVYPSGVVAVEGLDLEVAHGEFVSLLGPSGSGKTTTLRMIAGFEAPTAGDVVLGGKSIAGEPANRRPVNTVFQDYALFPHLDVRENVEFGLRAQGAAASERATRVREVLELVHLTGYEARSPSQLSGGQRQRVALARALVLRPRVLLLDEPLGALDLKLRRQMQIVLVELCRKVEASFVYVTHDQEEALAMSDRIAVLQDGRLQQYGTPQELYREPQSLLVADFVGENNLLKGVLVERSGSDAVVEVEGVKVEAEASALNGSGPGRNVIVAVRPESLELSSDPGKGIPGRVTQAIFSGADWRVVVRTAAEADVIVNLRGDRGSELQPGDEVRVAPVRGQARAFDGQED